MTDERGHLDSPTADEERGPQTEQDPQSEIDPESLSMLPPEPASATVLSGPPTEERVSPPHAPDLSVLDVRPTPGPPREYRFPAFERFRLDNGLTVISAHIPGRALLAANLLMPGGGASEAARNAGVTVLTARAMTEGTRRLDAIAFVEAAERLGAEIHAEASWEALAATLEVPRSRFPAALALLAEMVRQPAFPASEIERLREERLNDLLQARADPRRRVERVFPEAIYDPRSAYRRPLAGVEQTVGRLDRSAVVERHAEANSAAAATLIVAGDLTGLDLPAIVGEHLGDWPAGNELRPIPTFVTAHPSAPRVVLVDRPASPQSEVRIGHVGVPRKIPDFHAVSVLNAIVGGVFDSRLNRVIREERGYTYAIWSTFEMRRAAGPFVVRTGVETGVTGPAIADTLAILRGMGEAEIEPRELTTVRDYLVGVFPLRFEAPAQVAGALGGLVINELPDDELDRYRPQVAAVSAADVLAAAQRHIRPAELSIVLVGDAAKVEPQLRDIGHPPSVVLAADGNLDD